MGGKSGSGPIPQKGAPYDKFFEEKLKTYKERLPVKEWKIQNILSRKELIEEILSEQLDIEENHIFGSFARQTMIESLEGNDIDVLFLLNEEKHGQWLSQENGSENCLDKVKQVLEKDPRLKDCEIKIDRNAVTVSHKDLKIDVVPAFNNPKGGYSIPDTYGKQSWIQSDPRRFKRVMEIADKSHNGRVSETIRIARGWNENNGKPLKSFHIETMVYDYYENKPIKSKETLDQDTKNFFKELPWRIRMQTRDPVYSENRIDTYLTSEQRSAAIRKAKIASERLEKAGELSTEGAKEQSIKTYQKVFGKKFE